MKVTLPLLTAAIAVSGAAAHQRRSSGLVAESHRRMAVSRRNAIELLPRADKKTKDAPASESDKGGDDEEEEECWLKAPKTLAEGSRTVSDGCTAYRTVVAGEICLGIIEGGDTLEEFYKSNPSLDTDCQHLEIGTSYCVSTKIDSQAAIAYAATMDDVKDEKVSAEQAAVVAYEPGKFEGAAGENKEGRKKVAEEVAPSSPAAYVAPSPAPSSSSSASEWQPEPSSSSSETWSSSSSSSSWSPEPSPSWSAESSSWSSSSSWTPEPTTSWSSSTPEWTPESSSSSSWAPEPAPSPSSGGDGGAGGMMGTATYYWQNGIAGSCGTVNPDSAFIVAVRPEQGGGKECCGKKLWVTNTNTGVTLDAVCADTCPTCTQATDIDLSEGLFRALGATHDDGVFPVKWGFA